MFIIRSIVRGSVQRLEPVVATHFRPVPPTPRSSYSTIANAAISANTTAAASMSKPTSGPRPLVICGPSGSGKSTLLAKLRAELPDTFALCVSHTTRQPRAGESNGIEYHFVTPAEMSAAIGRGEFLETATFSGNQYGTSKQSVRAVQAAGKVCVLDIEVEGVKQIRATDLNPLLVFVLPPSVEELEQRLRGRKTESEESLQRRLQAAKGEMAYGTAPGNFDVVIPNRVLDQAYAELRDFVLKELQRQRDAGVNVSLRQVTVAPASSAAETTKRS